MKTLIVKNMLAELIMKQGFTVSSVVKKTGVNGKTIRRILKNSIRPSIKNEMNLISFYCSCVAEINDRSIN